MKALTALLTAILTGLGAYVGMPSIVTPELISLSMSAVSAVGAVFFYVRRAKAAVSPVV